jgi:hypothetical protein
MCGPTTPLLRGFSPVIDGRAEVPILGDSPIDPKRLVVNDFDELFADYPTITRVYFNGAKAAELYRRLASTSPAHVMRPGTKPAAWQAISQS